MTAEDREKLLGGDPAPVGPKLAGVLSELLGRGFLVRDVHVSTDGRYEVLLDREIDRQTSMDLVLPPGVWIYEDYDEFERQRGFGVHCDETGHCVNGPVCDGKGHG